MKAINQRAKKVMDVLTGYIDGANDHKIIDNTEGTFMPVHVEHVNNCKLGQIFSIAHYYEQNGDMMRDPDMEFIKGGDGEYYPISFWQDAPPVRDEPIKWVDGDIVGYNEKQQAALVPFANIWMKNIKEQQGLVI
ncbi:MAG: hypothetical protein WA977_08510 [Halobacteriota archaeon]